MSLKAKLEAIVYAAETPVSLEHIVQLVKDSGSSDGVTDPAELKSQVRASLEELITDYDSADHGVEVRQVGDLPQSSGFPACSARSRALRRVEWPG